MVCGENMPTKKLIDIIDEMNLKEDKVKENLIEKIERLANLIFDIDGQSGNLIFVNTLLEEIIEGKKVVRSELERCNRLWKRYQQ